MLSRKIRTTFSGLFIVCLLLIAVVFGLMFGYRVVLKQKTRYDYMEQIAKQQDFIQDQVDTQFAKELADKKREAKGEQKLSEAELAKLEENKLKAYKEKLKAWKKEKKIPLSYAVPIKGEEGLKPVFIDFGDASKQIAAKLESQGLIKSKTVFQVLSKLNGFDGNYQYGTHYLRPNMGYDELMFTLTLKPDRVLVVIPEGSTYIDIKNILRKSGISFNEAKMDKLMNSPEKFEHFDFLDGIKRTPGRNFLLDGYLFPDSYYFDCNASEISILSTLLNNTHYKLLDQYYERANTLNMTMDQVIILASIIQKESSVSQEMYKVSRVFSNRLAKGIALESCATINYLRQQERLEPVLLVKDNDLNRESAYNTYKNPGLTPGPICNPGAEAISAALYPDTSAESRNYLYFCAAGKTGRNVFANTLQEHQANIEKYLEPLNGN